MKRSIIFLVIMVFLCSTVMAQFKAPKVKVPDTDKLKSAAKGVARDAFLKVAKDIPFEVKSSELELSDPKYKVMGYSIDDFMKKVFIPALSKALNAMPDGTKVVIKGHASATGSENGSSTFIGNKKLSQQRAEAVMEYLTKQSGLNKDRFKIKALSSSEPKPGSDPENNENCRVSFDLE